MAKCQVLERVQLQDVWWDTEAEGLGLSEHCGGGELQEGGFGVALVLKWGEDGCRKGIALLTQKVGEVARGELPLAVQRGQQPGKGLRAGWGPMTKHGGGGGGGESLHFRFGHTAVVFCCMAGVDGTLYIGPSSGHVLKVGGGWGWAIWCCSGREGFVVLWVDHIFAYRGDIPFLLLASRGPNRTVRPIGHLEWLLPLSGFKQRGTEYNSWFGKKIGTLEF